MHMHVNKLEKLITIIKSISAIDKTTLGFTCFEYCKQYNITSQRRGGNVTWKTANQMERLVTEFN